MQLSNVCVYIYIDIYNIYLRAVLEYVLQHLHVCKAPHVVQAPLVAVDLLQRPRSYVCS